MKLDRAVIVDQAGHLAVRKAIYEVVVNIKAFLSQVFVYTTRDHDLVKQSEMTHRH